MKERPIIFNRVMVRAILDGRKTQTRRPLKPQPINGWEFGTASELGIKLGWIKSSHPRKGKFGVFTRREWTEGKFEHDIIPCPIGQPGERLWVRETFRVFNAADECGCSEFPCACPNDGDAIYFADPKANPNFKPSDDECPWEPSIHMPRWASRILLEITDIRVERVQDISEDDCAAEGITPYKGGYTTGAMGPFSSPILAFSDLWESTGGDWDANPWVWVIEFNVVEIKQ